MTKQDVLDFLTPHFLNGTFIGLGLDTYDDSDIYLVEYRVISGDLEKLKTKTFLIYKE